MCQSSCRFQRFWCTLLAYVFFAFTISAIIKKFDKLAAVLLALCLFLFVLLVHILDAASGDFKSVIGAIRDITMCGAALMYAQAFAKDNIIIG
jgi:hypothetical protein